MSASTVFSYSQATLQQLAEDVLKHARQKGATACEVDVSEGFGQSVTVRCEEVETIEFNRDKGIGVTVYAGQRKGYASRTIGIKLRYADFRSVTRDLTVPFGVSDGAEIRKVAGECLKRVPLAQKIRLLGVRASGLVPLAEVQSPQENAQSAFSFV